METASRILLALVVALISSKENLVKGTECNNDVVNEDQVDFLPPGATFDLPRDFTLPEDITTNPLSINDNNELMFQGRIVEGEAADEKQFPYQVFIKAVRISGFYS